jgi:hypothetical protein
MNSKQGLWIISRFCENLQPNPSAIVLDTADDTGVFQSSDNFI